MRVAGLEPQRPRPRRRRAGAADGAAAALDVVSVNVALAAETHRLLDAGRLARMRPDAVLVNTSRGEIVDLDALCDLLRAGHLGGAWLDVVEGEPRIPAERLEALAAVPNLLRHPAHLLAHRRDARPSVRRDDRPHPRVLRRQAHSNASPTRRSHDAEPMTSPSSAATSSSTAGRSSREHRRRATDASSTLTDGPLDARETLDATRPDRPARRHRRALPRLLGLRLGDVRERHARGGQGRRHHRRRHAARQAADPDRRGAARASSPRSPAPATSTTRRSAATRRGPLRDGADGRGGRELLQAVHRRRRPARDVPGRRRRPAARRAAAGGGDRADGHRALPRTPTSSTSRRTAYGRRPHGPGRVGRRAPVVQRAGRRAHGRAAGRGHRRPRVIAHVSSPQTMERSPNFASVASTSGPRPATTTSARRRSRR